MVVGPDWRYRSGSRVGIDPEEDAPAARGRTHR
jgi:hypothetical protein